MTEDFDEGNIHLRQKPGGSRRWDYFPGQNSSDEEDSDKNYLSECINEKIS